MFFWLIIAVAIALIPFTYAYAAWRAAPWVPSTHRTVDRSIALANIQPGQTIIDLGCGDGRLLVAAVGRGATAIGYEIAVLPYLVAAARRWTLPSDQRKRYRICFRDFWSENLSRADVIYAYLLPRVLGRLRTKLESELKPGTRVIVSTWPVVGWQAEKIDIRLGQIKLYRYRR